MTSIKPARTNQLTRLVFDDMPVRGLHVSLADVWQHIVGNKDYPTAIRHALGELTAAAVLLASNLKFDGSLILQVQGKGVLKMLVAEATSAHTCRATARWDEQASIDEHTGLRDLLGEGGMFVMTLQPQNGEPWQGVVALEGDTIAQMLGTNPVVVRRTMALLKEQGYVSSEKGHRGGWKLARPLAEGDFDFLEGQQLALEISDLQITLGLGLANGKLVVSDDDGTAVTRLKGRSAALLRLVTRHDDADTLFFQRELLLSGNTEIGLALKNALDGLDHERLPLPLPQLLKLLRAAVRTFNQKRA